MRYTVEISTVSIIGKGWLGQTITTEKNLSTFELEQVLGHIEIWSDNRQGLAAWLSGNMGDFQSITDFYAELETDEGTVTIDWEDASNECDFLDCMYGEED